MYRERDEELLGRGCDQVIVSVLQTDCSGCVDAKRITRETSMRVSGAYRRRLEANDWRVYRCSIVAMHTLRD